jgi:molecular chaperone HscC
MSQAMKDANMHFGIDLGSTNSLIAVFRDGKPELIPNVLGQVMTPSVVALQDGKIVVGDTARAIALAHPTHAVGLFKRAMGTDRSYGLGKQTFTAPELSAIILATLKADAEAFTGQPVTDVVISVPAYFNELQRKAVRTAGRIAGLNVTRLINEPTAAALAYGLHDRGEDARVVVLDLGGGTFDVSVLDLFEGVMEVRASAGDAFLGGEDFTEALAKYISQQAGLDVHDMACRPGLLTLAEGVKRTLSTEVDATVAAQINGRDVGMVISRERFDDVTAQLMTRLSAPLDRALHDAGIATDALNKVVLVGGATRMAAVRNFATRRLRQFPVMGLDPDQVVALGAAVQAALVAKDAALDDVVMTDVSAFTLGIDMAHQIGDEFREGYFAPMIERNSVIPLSREKRFSTVHLGQKEVRFGIYQGESPLVMNNLFLGQVTVTVPHNKQTHETCLVRFTYDVSGLLEVDVTVDSTGRRENLVITKLAGEMGEDDIKVALRKMAGLKVHPRDDAANLHMQARLQAAYAMARDDGRAWVTDLLVRFDQTVDGQDPVAIAALRVELHQALDDFEAHYVR